MQVTTGEALRALKAVSQLAEMKMPFGPAMAVRKMVRELGQVSEDAEAERQKLIVSHAVIGEDGKPKVEGNRYVLPDPLAFERAYADLMADVLYWGFRRTLERYMEFVAEFSEGGKWATLTEQYASDSVAVTPEDVTVLVGAMTTIITTLEDIERRAPGMWGIPVPVIEETPPEEEPIVP